MQIETIPPRESGSGSGSWGLLVLGVACLAFALYAHVEFTSIEEASGSVNVSRFAVMLYQLFGKWGLVALLGVGGGTAVLAAAGRLLLRPATPHA